jgi:hypothetical protein
VVAGPKSVPVLMEAESEISSVAPMSAAISRPLPQREQTSALVGLGVWQCEQIIYDAPLGCTE